MGLQNGAAIMEIAEQSSAVALRSTEKRNDTMEKKSSAEKC